MSLGSVGRLAAAALAVVGVAVFWKAIRARAYTFEVVEVAAGAGPSALTGRVLLPEGVEGVDDEIRLVALDEGERRFHVNAAPSGPGEMTFRIPSGFPTVRGEVNLQLFVNGVLRGSRPLGPLLPHRESFEAHTTPGVRAFVHGGAVDIEVQATLGASDSVLLYPLRTENQVWVRRDGHEMTGVGTGILRGTVSGPYVAEAKQIEFEIATTRYEPDVVTFEGAALTESGGGYALIVSKPTERVSTQGLRVRVPAQSNPVSDRQKAALSLEVDGHPEWVGGTRGPSPVAESLEPQRIFVTVDVPSLPSGQVGPLGPLRVLLPPHGQPQPVVKRYAVPIEPARQATRCGAFQPGRRLVRNRLRLHQSAGGNPGA